MRPSTEERPSVSNVTTGSPKLRASTKVMPKFSARVGHHEERGLREGAPGPFVLSWQAQASARPGMSPAP